MIGLIIGDDDCLIVDSGNSPKHAREFQLELEKMELPPIKYLVLTHHHCDHSFGMSQWNLVSIANYKTKEYLKTYQEITYDDEALELAKHKGILNDFFVTSIKNEIEDRNNFQPLTTELSFDGEMTIDLGGITCELRHITSPHTDDSTIIYIPEEKTMFLGDSLYGKRSDGFNSFDDEIIFPMMDLIKEYEVEHFISSYEPAFGNNDFVSFDEHLRLGFSIADNCSSLEAGLIEYENRFDKEAPNDLVFFMKSFGLR
ncbi:MBL fold metallo-hydrolase [Planococcus sp. A6]|uniref:MBL fold metallo-hydrolase n=1 Tax=Planococcus sp. A6 TaxID=2992760 RepID=UPI00237A5BC7|nr:MBL fold metallo-hydrolase [Planococcus sp. A6]MDE0582261.1 MBL fold metallo-hydrolase [Planococcus sp. A6]